jgi:hypothetical protein
MPKANAPDQKRAEIQAFAAAFAPVFCLDVGKLP